MFGQAEYQEYVRLQKFADAAFDADEPEIEEYFQRRANEAYQKYEYAAGIKDPELDL